MVKVIDCGKEEFVERVKDRQLYCFGIGKAFRRFCEEFDEVPISGVIDNYHYLDAQPIERKAEYYPVMSLRGAVPALTANSVIVITSPAFEDIVEQLDDIEELDGLECYIEMALNGYQGVREAEQTAWRQIIAGLMERKKSDLTNHNFSRNNQSSVTKRFQIWDYIPAERIQGNKARADIRYIAGQMGYQAVKIHRSRGSGNDAVRKCSRVQIEQEWHALYDMLPQNAIVLLQHPFPSEQPERDRMLLKIKEDKKAQFIAVVHDVEQLRVVYDSAYRQAEYEFMLQTSDVLIVHNEEMKRFFIEQGVPEKRLISLQIFDYLYLGNVDKKEFDKAITIAGNLGQEKSPYIGKLGELAPIKVHLYGSNFKKELTDEEADNIVYHGSFPSEEVPKLLKQGFGLVWDGEALETCSGATGRYLRYNNPHKLSLYLAAGIPVIVWEESATADFVKRNGLGLTVRSLHELKDALNNIDIAQYENYLAAVNCISEKIRKGYYLKQAVSKAETILGIRQEVEGVDFGG